MRSRCRRPTQLPFARSRAGHGASSRTLCLKLIAGYRRTIFKRTQGPSSRIGPRPQILACICSRRLRLETWDGWALETWWNGWKLTLQTMSKLEQFRGHFYNWYDTRDLRPLDPKYVSSVDSGNIAGHLLTLANGCRELIQKSSIESSVLAGLGDSIRLLEDALSKVTESRRTHTVTLKQLRNAVRNLVNMIGDAPVNAVDWGIRFVELKERAQTVADMAQTLAQELGDPAASELRLWAEAARATVESHSRDAAILIPWLRLSSAEIMVMAQRPAEQAP